MTGIETIGGLHTLMVMNSWYVYMHAAQKIIVTKYHSTANITTNTVGKLSIYKLPHFGQGYASCRALFMLQ